MRDYLILKLQGVMQAWGEHTFEGLRPSTNFPTRSALTGLLAACLGIDRNDRQQQQALANSFLYAVRQDETEHSVIKMTDYHTVKDAREDYVGLKSHDTIITQREYLLDAAFTVAIWNTEGAEYSLEQLKAAVCQPRYTPFLGRRSCPITRPLYESRVQAINSDEALKLIEPVAGVIYSEEDLPDVIGRNKHRHRVRDMPLPNQPRQFASRMVYVYGKENADVSE
ncbi:type I-E CRISPR-associated protein Cas5/CasD [Thiothrix subterranea]|uniref:Type I-E CRISPR-associated protein Cas5/CasD n=1 Tax=Thiothrix subterranea TaxID=2735563 RepID=A0AA51MSY8_9GAMM|nr:type I-E CRISPR-associated protein Cas5/CasD [Thiothrix subterranea]MDQ5767358.1 type I-E CRISPR-associated protein Cas5/CasD [Thiothrix subterranea]WML88781.1 type I-E CRISPR-associated protein Cas5/CasD [Thiothrix subterranea]